MSLLPTILELQYWHLRENLPVLFAPDHGPRSNAKLVKSCAGQDAIYNPSAPDHTGSSHVGRNQQQVWQPQNPKDPTTREQQAGLHKTGLAAQKGIPLWWTTSGEYMMDVHSPLSPYTHTGNMYIYEFIQTCLPFYGTYPNPFYAFDEDVRIF